MKNYIIYDLEATCWEHRPPGYVQEIIEIGAFRINAYGEIRGKFNRFVRPILHPILSPFCRQLTQISQQDINRAAPFPDVIEEFWKWARIGEENYTLCSWGAKDQQMLVHDCRLHQLDTDWVKPHANLKQQYMFIKGLQRPVGLKRATEMENIVFTGTPHRGISDAENLVKIFLKYLGHWAV